MSRRPTAREVAQFNQAASSGDMKTLQDMLTQFGAAIVNERNHLDWTPLMCALQYNKMEAAALLIRNGGTAGTQPPSTEELQEKERRENEEIIRKLKQLSPKKVNLKRKP